MFFWWHKKSVNYCSYWHKKGVQNNIGLKSLAIDILKGKKKKKKLLL